MSNRTHWVLNGCVVASLLLIAVGLHLWGSVEIRANSDEVLFLTCVAGAWILLATKLFAWLGLSFRDDVIERKNTAALVGLCGAVMSVAVVYAGGSFGEGPSYLNNLFAVGLATTGLFLFWILLEIAGKTSISIAEERDLASGIRLCGFLLAIGLVLGRAVAGDWHSASATIHDFVIDGWPAIVIFIAALANDRFLRPSRRRPFPSWPSSGLVPALMFPALAVA